MAAMKDTITGKWCVQVRYQDWQGNRQRKFKRGFPTKREALEWEREFLLQRSDDLTMTFAQFVKVYEEDRRPRLRESTWLTKEYMINDKLLPYFGQKSISEITAKDIIRWQNQLLAMRDKNGDPYSPTYLKAIHNQLTAIFTHAFKFYGLKSNPASKAGSVGQKHAKEMQFWTLDEYSRFADVTIEDPIAFYAFEVLYWCGIRLGELLALTYEDVNFENKTLRVNKSYTVVRGEEIISDPKTPKSKRTIIMPDFLIEELEEYAAYQYSPKPADRMFSISKNYLRAHLRKNAEAAGVKPIRVHDLRHSHVSHLIELGFSPVAIAERVGHESIEITLRYAHLFPTKQSEMAVKLGEAARAL